MSASSAPAAPRLADRHPPFFVQSLAVGDELRGLSRLDVFSRICRGKRVLHVGCIDWPITDVEESLHVQLDAVCELDGFDIHDEAFGVIGSRVRGRLFSDWEQLQPGYDVVLVPEVLEHVPDVEAFLGRLHSLNAPSYVITVPDAYSCFARHFDYDQASQSFTEIVHPDHNCWYTPFTLANVIRKYTPRDLQGLWFFNRISLLAIATQPPRGTP